MSPQDVSSFKCLRPLAFDSGTVKANSSQLPFLASINMLRAWYPALRPRTHWPLPALLEPSPAGLLFISQALLEPSPAGLVYLSGPQESKSCGPCLEVVLATYFWGNLQGCVVSSGVCPYVCSLGLHPQPQGEPQAAWVAACMLLGGPRKDGSKDTKWNVFGAFVVGESEFTQPQRWPCGSGRACD